MKKDFRRLLPVLITCGVVLLVCLLRWSDIDFFERLEQVTYDMRVRAALKWPATVATNLGFVFIDENSIRKVQDGSLGYHYGLYWPRQIYGRLVEELSAQGAAAVAFDVIFGELRPDHPLVEMADHSTMESDAFFALQMKRASNVIIAVTRDLTPPALFLTNAMALGDISTDKDSDGILRRAKAFRTYRKWHKAFQQVEADPGYGVDLRRAEIQPRRIILPRAEGDPIEIPLREDGMFDVTDFWGDNLPPGVARWAKPYTDERVWHMGVVLAAKALNLDLKHADIDLPHGQITLHGPNGIERVIPVDADGYFYIDWRMPPNHPQLEEQPIYVLLEQDRARIEGRTNGLHNTWRGKYVVVGSSALANDLTDRGATPLRKDTLLVSKHWNVANSIITGHFVRRSPLTTDLALIALLGIVAAVLTWKLRALQGFIAVMLVGTAYIALGVGLYIGYRYWIPLVLPVFGALLITYLCLLAWRVVFEQAERRRVRAVFSKMVSPKIVTELLAAERLSLGGARREITVFFADVRGFTELTDKQQDAVAEHVRKNNLAGVAAEACFEEQARETLATVNLYLGVIADVIIRLDGTLDKFIGDCVMAYWGAPTANPAHAVACVRAAIQAQLAVHKLNQGRMAQNETIEAENSQRLAAGISPRPLLPVLHLGSGINSGLATAGLMGSEVADQLSYTVFGREVNLASRLEGASGRGRIFISETTYQHLCRDDPALAGTCVPLPPVQVKGFRSAVNVYEVPWKPLESPPPDSRSAKAAACEAGTDGAAVSPK